MGTGKSTVGRALADLLGYDFVDTDDLIEIQHGPITDVFAAMGEAAFRSMERAVVNELADTRRCVIATGGRLMLDPDNVRRLCCTARVYCLTAPVDEIVQRVADGSADRPLLRSPNPAQRVAELLAERSAGYGRFAQVHTGGRAPASIAAEIIGWHVPPERHGHHLVGVAVLPALERIFDRPVGAVVGADAARYADQIPGGSHAAPDPMIVQVGASDDDHAVDDHAVDVWVPTALNQPGPRRPWGVVWDAGVLQDASGSTLEAGLARIRARLDAVDG